MKDNIICCNCGYRGQVDRGEEICPECHKNGCLAWDEEKENEEED